MYADGAMYISRSLCSYGQIVAVTVPAIVLNAAPTAVSTVQTSLLGHLRHASQSQVAAFAAASVCANFVVFLFNFLVDGVSAKIGHAAGARSWRGVQRLARMAMLAALLAGLTAAAVYAAALHPVDGAMDLHADVRLHLRPYWWKRCAVIPLQLWVMAMNGVLNGYNRVALNATLLSMHALLEITASALMLTGACGSGLAGLQGLGIASIAAYCATALTISALVLCVRPQGAPRTFSLTGMTGPDSRWDSFSPSDYATANSPALSGGASFSSARETLLGSAASCESYAASQASPPFVTPPPSPRRTSQCSTDYSPTPLVCSREAPLAGPTAGFPWDQLDGAPAAGEEPSFPPREFLTFAGDGVNVMLRSALLQATFLSAMVCAARLGAPALAAHQVIAQLWLLTSYIVDGFANAGTVLGSRLGALKALPDARRDLRSLCWRLTWMGVATGIAIGALLFVFKDDVIQLFTADSATSAQLEAPRLWLLICIAQPINAGVFVYDGLVYAAHYFAFVRNQMLIGTIFVFVPTLALGLFFRPCLAIIWLAKALTNLWRLVSATTVIHARFVR